MADIIKAGDYFNKGEKITAEFLSESLPDNFHIINNFTIHQANKPYEIDSVIISSNGIFLLEIKNWYGEWKQNAGIWITNNGSVIRNNPFNLLDTKTRVLRSALVEISPEYKYFSCIGFLVIPNKPEDSNFVIDKGYKKRLFRTDENLINALKGKDYLFHEDAKNISENDINSIITNLIGLNEKRSVFAIGNWVIQNELGIETSDFISTNYLAKHSVLSKLAHIRIYDIPFSDKEKRTEILLRVRKEQEALELLEGMDGILDVLDMGFNGNDDSQIYLATRYCDFPLLAHLIRGRIVFSEKEAVQIAINILDILRACHEKNIIHRSLNPKNIYLNPTTLEVKLTRFDLSRIGFQKQGNTFIAGLPDIDFSYSAPEIIRGENIYTFGTDIYSFGMVISTIIKGKRGEIKNPDLKRILNKCTEINPANRYCNTQEVISEIKKINSISS